MTEKKSCLDKSYPPMFCTSQKKNLYFFYPFLSNEPMQEDPIGWILKDLQMVSYKELRDTGRQKGHDCIFLSVEIPLYKIGIKFVLNGLI